MRIMTEKKGRCDKLRRNKQYRRSSCCTNLMEISGKINDDENFL